VDGRLRCFDLGVTGDSLLPEVEAHVRVVFVCSNTFLRCASYSAAIFQTPWDRLALSKETPEPASAIARNPDDGQRLGVMSATRISAPASPEHSCESNGDIVGGA
jgi:hypothetical protein